MDTVVIGDPSPDRDQKTESAQCEHVPHSTMYLSGLESESVSVPESLSGNVNKP